MTYHISSGHYADVELRFQNWAKKHYKMHAIPNTTGISMSTYNDDLGESLDFLLRNLLRLKKNEELLICCDRGSDEKVVKAAVAAGERIGATTTVGMHHSLRGLKEDPEPDLARAMRNADVVCDFSENYLCYTLAWAKTLESGARLCCLGNLSSEAVIRCIGKVDINEIMALGRTLAGKTRNANVIRITSESGTDITLRMNVLTKLGYFFAQTFHRFILFSFVRTSGYGTQTSHDFVNRVSWVENPTGVCNESGQSTYLSGQVNFNGIKKSINGTLVFDGSVCPPFELGVLRSPILCKVRHGRIIDIVGDQEAKIFREWLKNFNNSSMFDIVHFSYGFNPGAKLSSCISEAERLYGCIGVGMGWYPSHSDGVIKKPTVQINRDFIEIDGKYQLSSKRNLRKNCNCTK
jgi:2,5-dihydroxypyridine 5,6-dioxygenase